MYIIPTLLMFQFYCSAIKRISSFALVGVTSRFNSTVVRLRVILFFNESTLTICFNSTVVRLREERKPKKVMPEPLFQFYCSAIKSREND